MLELLESNIHKLSLQLREYIYLNDSYDTEVIHTIADKLKVKYQSIIGSHRSK